MTTSRSPSPPHGYGYRGGEGYVNGHVNGYAGEAGSFRYPDYERQQHRANGAPGGQYPPSVDDERLYRQGYSGDNGYPDEMTASDSGRFRSAIEPEMTETPLIIDGQEHMLAGEADSPPLLLNENSEEMLKYTIYEQRPEGQRNVIGTLTTVRGRLQWHNRCPFYHRYLVDRVVL